MSAGYPSTLETHTLETASLPLPTQGNCQWLVLQTAKCKGLRHRMAVAQEVQQVIFYWEDWWFDPWLLQCSSE